MRQLFRPENSHSACDLSFNRPDEKHFGLNLALSYKTKTNEKGKGPFQILLSFLEVETLKQMKNCTFYLRT